MLTDNCDGTPQSGPSPRRVEQVLGRYTRGGTMAMDGRQTTFRFDAPIAGRADG